MSLRATKHIKYVSNNVHIWRNSRCVIIYYGWEVYKSNGSGNYTITKTHMIDDPKLENKQVNSSHRCSIIITLDWCGAYSRYYKIIIIIIWE